MLTLQQTQSIHDFMNFPKIEFIAYIYNNLGDKTILYLIFNCINGFVGVQNGKADQPV